MLSDHWKHLIFFYINIFSYFKINTAAFQLHLQQQTLPSSSGVSGFEIICIVNGLQISQSPLRISLYCPSSSTFPCFQACYPVCGSTSEVCEELPYLKTIFCGERYDPTTLQKQIIFRFTNPSLEYFYSRNGFSCEFLHLKSQSFYWLTTTSSPAATAPTATTITTTLSTTTTSTKRAIEIPDVSLQNVSSTGTNLSTKAILISTVEGQYSKKKNSNGPTSKTISGSPATSKEQWHVNLSDLLIAVLILLATLVTLFLIIFVCIRWILIRHYIGNRNKILMGDLLCMRQTIELQRDNRARLNGAATAFLQERASLQSHQSRRSIARLSTGGGSASLLEPFSGINTVSPECLVPVITYANHNDQETLSQPVIYLPLERLRNENGMVQWRPLSIVDPYMSQNVKNFIKPLHRSASQLESGLPNVNMHGTMNGLSSSRNRSGEIPRVIPQHSQSRTVEIMRPPPIRSSGQYRNVDEAGPSDIYAADIHKEMEEWNRSPDRRQPPVPHHGKQHFLFPNSPYSNNSAISHFYDHSADLMSSSYHGTIQPYAEDFTVPINYLHRANTTGISMSNNTNLQKSRDTKRLSRSHSRSLQQGSRLGSHEHILEEDTEA